MALTRKLLKGMGLTDEQVDTIIEAHTDTVDGLKADVSKYKTDAEKLPSVQKELDDLKAAGDGGYKEKYEKEHKAFEDFKADQTAKETKATKEKALRGLLTKLGISEKRQDAIVKVTDLDRYEMDGENIKDADAAEKALKEEWADFIPTTTTTGASTSTPPANTGGSVKTKEEIYKMENGRYVLSASERQAELAKLYQHEKGE